MKILALNCGSSTLKFSVIDTAHLAPNDSLDGTLAHGAIQRVGDRASVDFRAEGWGSLNEEATVADHGEAARLVLEWLDEVRLTGAEGLEAVGHRVVHGGERFVQPTPIDDGVIEAIAALRDLAPLHNNPSLQAIRATQQILGPSIPMVATFDTAFHRSLPARASQYAIPQELAARHRVRRYGFHGLAHRYMTERYAAIMGKPIHQTKLITLQLGAGCSATAVDGGRSIDTSMGFTPLEGLMMATRSGDLDPSLVGHLARQEAVSVDEVESWLNTRSGLLGVSGKSADMKNLLEAKGLGDSRATLAVEMFCYRVRKYIGAYMAALGGADAIIFGGGIGENAPEVRADICTGMEWCGLSPDPARNASAVGSEGRINVDGSRIEAYVVLVDETVIIARDTFDCLRS